MRIRSAKPYLTLLAVYFAFALVLLPFTNASAQAEITLENVRVDIWPEYDRPSALVIYNISISPSVSLPADVTLRIPTAAGQPHAVAWQAPDQGLYELMYEKTISGDWTEITFNTPAPDLRLEYYDPGIQKTENQRTFAFNWPGDYAVQNLSIMVQQPVNATNMKLVPDAGGGRPGSDGLTYHTLVVGQVNAGTTFELDISYEKADDTLTNPEQYQNAQPVQAVNGSTAGRVTLDQTLPWAVGGAGILLIAGGLLWYWKTNTAAKHSREKGVHRHTRTSAAAAEAAPPAAAGADPSAFCHQCGKKASPGDVFCRSCGTKLR